MFKHTTYVLIILTLGAIMNGNAAAEIFPYSYKTQTLDNGLKYIMIPMETPGLVSYFSIVRTGSRDEYEPGHSGFAHLFEHMMFRGTKNFPGDVYDGMITRLGADGNAYTTDDYTCYHMTFTSDDLDEVAMLESDRFQNLDYNKAEFQTETGAVYGEYRKGRTNPYSVLFEDISDLAFNKHTYKHTTIGFEKDIKAMPGMYDYSKSFFQRYYRPDNVVLLIVGDINMGQTSAIVQKYYGNWTSGYQSPNIQTEPPQHGPRSKVVQYDGRTLPILDVAYKGPAFNADKKDFAALEVLGELAFGENSDLYKQLVIQEQKVEFITPSFQKTRDPGLLHIISMIRSDDDIDSVRQLIIKTLDHYKSQPVDPERLKELKSRETYGFLMNLDTPSNVANNLARYVALSGGVGVVDVYFQDMQKLTPADIQQVAKKYFTEQTRNVIILKGAQE